MDLDGFDTNACLANNAWTVQEYGWSAYFVRKYWLDTLNLDERAEVMKNLHEKLDTV
jgi:hypothetical protein